jgi:hypothetical protein
MLIRDIKIGSDTENSIRRYMCRHTHTHTEDDLIILFLIFKNKESSLKTDLG